MIFRTPEAKKDLVRSWNRPARPFFAAGACHILAAAFLETYPEAGYHPVIIRPAPGQRGRHVFVTNGQTVFDYHGYTQKDDFFAHYFRKIHHFFPTWQGTILGSMESPLSPNFCEDHGLRSPEQFFHDPKPRAIRFVLRFPRPFRPFYNPVNTSAQL